MVLWWNKKESTVFPLKKEDDTFLSVATHELRSPLSIIKWYTEMLLDGDAGPLTVDQIKYLKTIETSNQRAIDLVRSLLNVSRLELGTFSIIPDNIRLSDCVLKVLKEKGIILEERKVSVSLDLHQEEELEVLLDKQICLVILRHVIGNAIMFSQDGGAIEVSLNLFKKGELVGEKKLLDTEIIVAVSDHGVGIKDEDKVSVYHKFFKGSNVSDQGESGSGLGLFIVKSILEKTGGDIWFTSLSGVGTTFYISFPVSGMIPKEGKTTLD